MTRHKNFRHGHGHTPGQGTRGGKSSPEYVSWSGMKARCFGRTSTSFADYGGAGIGVCERWLVFENFLADMGRRPSGAHSIERIDNARDYGPGNCRWATARDQANNRRTNVLISHNGKSMTLAQWAQEVGVKYPTLWWRVRVAGWSFDEAIN